MLGALADDDDESDVSVPLTKPKLKKKREKQIKSAPKDTNKVIQVDQQLQTEVPTLNGEGSQQSTDVDVTPLPSDELSFVPPEDAPLTLAELHPSPPKEAVPLRSALKELKLLTLNQSPSQYPQPGKIPYPSGNDKENVSHHVQFLHQANHLSSQSQQQHQPFGKLMERLREMNAKMSHGPPPIFRTLSGATSPSSNLLSNRDSPMFPPINAWTEQTGNTTAPQPQIDGKMQIPLLDLHHGLPSQSQPPPSVSSLPQNNPSQPRSQFPTHHLQQNSFRMPLLHLGDKPRIFSHIEDNQGELRLVPPEDVMAHELRTQQQNYLQNKKLHSFAKQQLGVSGGPSLHMSQLQVPVPEIAIETSETADETQEDQKEPRDQESDADADVEKVITKKDKKTVSKTVRRKKKRSTSPKVMKQLYCKNSPDFCRNSKYQYRMGIFALQYLKTL